MKVGVPTEIKTDEYRVSLTPAGVRELVEHGHEAIIQSEAGVGSTIPDEEYTAQGARIAPDAASVFEEAELILGVKEPQPHPVRARVRLQGAQGRPALLHGGRRRGRPRGPRTLASVRA